MSARRRVSTRRRRRLVLLASVLLALGMAVTACSATVSGQGTEASLTAQQIFKLAAPGTIQVYGKLEGSDDEYSFGTGIIYDADHRYALTNAHVVDGVSDVRVRFNDNTQADAKILGRSPCDDVAVLQLASMPSSASVLPLGDSAAVQTADRVAVLGYPGSLASIQSEKVVFTQGLVQSVHVKANQADDIPTYPDTIQHSATVNHGNSGGPLVDDHGQVVGINTLSNSGTEGQSVQGQYYSISIDHVKPLLAKLQGGTSIAYAGWDLEPLADLPMKTLFPASGYGTAAQGSAADQLLHDASVNGMVVTGVDEDTPAADAVEPGDLITEINGQQVTTTSQVCSALGTSTSQTTLPLVGRYLVDSDADHKFGEPWTGKISF